MGPTELVVIVHAAGTNDPVQLALGTDTVGNLSDVVISVQPNGIDGAAGIGDPGLPIAAVLNLEVLDVTVGDDTDGGPTEQDLTRA